MRPKLFGGGKPVPLDREAKNRLVVRARAMVRATEPGKHYGKITAKAFEVFKVLLWKFHNARDGRCFPSYETIAEAAGCARSTVYEAITMLETAGLLSWVNRVARIWEQTGERDLLGRPLCRQRVIRTSNGYYFRGEAPRSDLPSGTTCQESFPLIGPANPGLAAALARLGAAVKISGAA